MDDDLCRHNIRALRNLLINNEVTPRELVDVGRIKAVEQTLGALPIPCLDKTRTHARRLMDTASWTSLGIDASPPDFTVRQMVVECLTLGCRCRLYRRVPRLRAGWGTAPTMLAARHLDAALHD